ncbi:helix-turn-helix transcriptional regulator [Microbacterium sp. ZOR0019]|uniref:helix-turn-helix transcriptional regulator n=1 Tax=Microbacterium sp. ZOR0019 TaxID=1339233 RepID=UPI000648289F|nr:LuxR C-terminal-related transcriptional regulator [Microbacterium sp. ZOR0019]
MGIIDSRPALVLGITVLVNAQPDMTFIGSGRSVRELLSAGTTPDVVLVDPAIADPQAQAAAVTALLSRGIGVLLFTDAARARSTSEHPEPGAVETIRKTDPLHRVIAGIRAAQRSRSGESSAGVEIRNPHSAPGVTLSPREAEVLELYATGATAAHVAHALGITRNTVVDHIKRIRLKYIAAGRPAFTKVDLFRRAVEDGLVPDEPA